MAIKAFTRKTSGPTSSDEFLSKYEELLKRNKAGKFLTGYEATSQNPMYLEGKVINPSGLGETAQQSAGRTRTITTLPEIIDAIYSFDPEQVNSIDPSLLTDEEKTQVSQALQDASGQATQSTENLTAEANKPYIPQINPSSPVPQEGDINFIGPLQRNYKPQEGTGNADTMWNQGWNEGFNNPDRPYAGSDPNAKSGYEAGQNEYKTRSGNTEFNQTMQDTSSLLNQADTAMQPQVAPTATLQQVGESFANRVDENVAKERGMSVDQLREENSMQIPDYVNPVEKDTVRQAIGNLVSFIGDKTGLPETGLSEKIAGGPTKEYNKVMATDNMQSGSGLERLKSGEEFTPSTMQSRPDFSSIGLKRSIGNVAGIQDQMASTPNNQSTPSGQTMASVMRSVQPTQSSNPVMQSITQNKGIGSNQPSNQPSNQGGQSNQSNRSGGTTNVTQSIQPAKSSSTKSSSVSNLFSSSKSTPAKMSIPTQNVGVGSNQPAQQSQPQQNIVQKVVNSVSSLLSNLFRRK